VWETDPYISIKTETASKILYMLAFNYEPKILEKKTGGALTFVKEILISELSRFFVLTNAC